MFTRLVFIFGGFSNSLHLSRFADFDDQYVKRCRFAQGCAFWDSENN